MDRVFPVESKNACAVIRTSALEEVTSDDALAPIARALAEARLNWPLVVIAMSPCADSRSNGLDAEMPVEVAAPIVAEIEMPTSTCPVETNLGVLAIDMPEFPVPKLRLEISMAGETVDADSSVAPWFT